VRNNHHLSVFTGGDLSGDHPMAEVEPTTGQPYNMLFRATHDIFGHAAGGFPFTEAGEHSAYGAHMQMYGPEARKAVRTETQGQSNWFFNNRDVRNGKALGDFPQQKATILPEPQTHEEVTQPQKHIQSPLAAAAGIPAADTALHEGAHLVVANRMGLPAIEIQSHLHPRVKVQRGVLAQAHIDLSSLPGIFFDQKAGTFRVDPSKVTAETLQRYGPVSMAGGTAEWIKNRKSILENPTMSGDFGVLNTIRSALNMPDSEFHVLIADWIKQAADILQEPGTMDKLVAHSATRNPDTHPHYIMDYHDVQDMLRDITGEEPNAPQTGAVRTRAKHKASAAIDELARRGGVRGAAGGRVERVAAGRETEAAQGTGGQGAGEPALTAASTGGSAGTPSDIRGGAYHPDLQAIADKYGVSENPAGHGAGAQFITPDGKFIHLPPGVWHDYAIKNALGEERTKPNLEEPGLAPKWFTGFIDDTGAIRVRHHPMAKEGRSVSFSVPKQGVTPEQIDAMKASVRNNMPGGRGNIQMERSDVSVDNKDLVTKHQDFATANHVEPMLRSIGAHPEREVAQRATAPAPKPEIHEPSDVGFIDPQGKLEALDPRASEKGENFADEREHIDFAANRNTTIETMLQEGWVRKGGIGNYEVDKLTPQNMKAIEMDILKSPSAKQIYIEFGDTLVPVTREDFVDKYNGDLRKVLQTAMTTQRQVAPNWAANMRTEMEKQSAGAIDPKTGLGDGDAKVYGTEFYPEARAGQPRLDHIPTEGELKHFYNEHKDLLDRHPELRIGWDKTKDGYEINIGAASPSRAGAMLVAKKLGQRAIWDNAKADEIQIGGAGTETRFPNYSLEERLKDLQRTPVKGYEDLPLDTYDDMTPDERQWANAPTRQKSVQKELDKMYKEIPTLHEETRQGIRIGQTLGGWWQRYMDTFAALGEGKTPKNAAPHTEALKQWHAALSGNKSVQMANRLAWGSYKDWWKEGRPRDRKSIDKLVQKWRGMSDYKGGLGIDTQKLYQLVNHPAMWGKEQFTGELWGQNPLMGVSQGALKIPSMGATVAGKGNLMRVVNDTHMKDFYGQKGLSDAKYVADSIIMRRAARDEGLQAGEGQEQLWGTILGIKELIGQGVSPNDFPKELNGELIAGIGKDYAEIIQNDPELADIFEELKQFGLNPGGRKAQQRLTEIVASRPKPEETPVNKDLLTSTVERIKGGMKSPPPVKPQRGLIFSQPTKAKGKGANVAGFEQFMNALKKE
jgi:hypothetical protein